MGIVQRMHIIRAMQRELFPSSGHGKCARTADPNDEGFPHQNPARSALGCFCCIVPQSGPRTNTVVCAENFARYTMGRFVPF